MIDRKTRRERRDAFDSTVLKLALILAGVVALGILDDYAETKFRPDPITQYLRAH